MSRTRGASPLFPLLAFLFAAGHLAYEHWSGGVRSHHLLDDPDLPSISNWLGLVTLPLLGLALARRVRGLSTPAVPSGLTFPVLAALVGAFLYGTMLAASFFSGAEVVTSVAFFGLFVCAAALPVYRAEYLLGFVGGMTFAFGGVLPLIVAAVFALISLVLRYTFRAVMARVRG
jgi:hypothetical protein